MTRLSPCLRELPPAFPYVLCDCHATLRREPYERHSDFQARVCRHYLSPAHRFTIYQAWRHTDTILAPWYTPRFP